MEAEAAGTSSAFAQAMELAKVRATVAVLGTYWQELAVAAMPLSMKELTVVGAYAYGHHAGHREVHQHPGEVGQRSAAGARCGSLLRRGLGGPGRLVGHEEHSAAPAVSGFIRGRRVIPGSPGPAGA